MRLEECADRRYSVDHLSSSTFHLVVDATLYGFHSVDNVLVLCGRMIRRATDEGFEAADVVEAGIVVVVVEGASENGM